MVDFDISPEELPIFIAEADENFQSLEEILVILEKSNGDEEKLQTAFRAAHTLKGMAGMINHGRMVAVTHAMETIFDAMRKNSLGVSSEVIDACLEAIDSLRQLKEEVVTSNESNVDIDALVCRFDDLLNEGRVIQLETNLEAKPEKISVGKPVVKVAEKKKSKPENDNGSHGQDGTIPVIADISPKSVASAARAFQLILALQEAGQITYQEPPMEVIDSALPVRRFLAYVKTNMPVDEVRKKLMMVSEVERLLVGQDEISKNENHAEEAASPEEKNSNNGYEMLGEYLLKKMVITKDQLDEVLVSQKGKAKKLLGELLVESGLLSQNQLDEEIKHMIAEQKSITNAKTSNSAARKNNGNEMTVRTSVEHLNSLMNMVGELITDRNHIYQLRSRLENEIKQHRDVEELSQTVAHLGRITDQLQEEVLSIRMLPVSNVFSKFPRLVRDLSHKLNKKIELVIHGEETELDRSVIDEINDPIIHMLRNSIDHGIEDPETRIKAGKPEVGTITLSAQHEQGHIIITVEDDGQGIDTRMLRKKVVSKGLVTQEEADQMGEDEAVNLIFMSGLSTSKEVTDISGRGVGMDIVRNNIQRINGTINIENRPGQGTQFQISLPLTLAIVPTLLVDMSETTYAFPLVMVAEILRLEARDIQYIRGKPVTMLRETVLPLVGLNEVFDLKDTKPRKTSWKNVVVVHYGKQKTGIIVDNLLGQEEVVVKSLGSLIGDVQGISSAAILGDGRVALIIDVPGLLRISGIH